MAEDGKLLSEEEMDAIGDLVSSGALEGEGYNVGVAHIFIRIGEENALAECPRRSVVKTEVQDSYAAPPRDLRKEMGEFEPSMSELKIGPEHGRFRWMSYRAHAKGRAKLIMDELLALPENRAVAEGELPDAQAGLPEMIISTT